MLGDDDAAESHQSVCSLCFEGEVKPLVGVLNVHICFGNDGADAEEECGITGNNLCIRVSTDITDLDLAVFAHDIIDILVEHRVSLEQLIDSMDALGLGHIVVHQLVFLLELLFLADVLAVDGSNL